MFQFYTQSGRGSFLSTVTERTVVVCDAPKRRLPGVHGGSVTRDTIVHEKERFILKSIPAVDEIDIFLCAYGHKRRLRNTKFKR